ncbi:DNA replication and repair protein RecF [Burkholderia aenigmatica]|uniref:DNA replication and repair protein RecF n=1 Tax=Burkholderia aenigmatica TaxID=2015348 RepID=A0A6P2HIF3_9BURK|nr:MULTISPECIES: AAA family ATPase [Burkholderia]VWB17476.1 DNA replication and repair protein RecF [Burkholderia aenigmatica]
MHIEHISIKNVGAIGNLELSLNSHMNLICGPNGIGKSTVLDSIGQLFSYAPNARLQTRYNCSKSIINASINLDGTTSQFSSHFSAHIPEDNQGINGGAREHSNNLIVLKTHRTFTYQNLNAITRDPTRHTAEYWNTVQNGISTNETKGWFVNRIVFEPHPNSLKESQRENLSLAKSVFSILNKEFKFSHINASTHDIILDTPDGNVYYEYLSSGFKSSLSILLGILREIEFRFQSEQTTAKEFDGIVLIDELELHLHPEWQSKIVEALKAMFPCAQFVCTTHSPHIIQAAEPSEVIALTRDGSGTVVQKSIPSSKYGFRGWTVEEVLEDVMGMEDLRTATLRRMLDSFGKAIDDDDSHAAKRIYDELTSALHPASHLRKILSLQLASVEEIEEGNNKK